MAVGELGLGLARPERCPLELQLAVHCDCKKKLLPDRGLTHLAFSRQARPGLPLAVGTAVERSGGCAVRLREGGAQSLTVDDPPHSRGRAHSAISRHPNKTAAHSLASCAFQFGPDCRMPLRVQ
jgi:hypothetical protein